jgi:thioredoxin reductase (NADPH)
MSDTIYDVLIIGGGPGGLTAGIYASRDGLGTLLLEMKLCGGLAASTSHIENYPGFPDGVSGSELVEKFKKQAVRFGTRIAEFKEVTGIEPLGKTIKIRTNKDEYETRALIIASGSVPKKLNIPGEDELAGRGVSYCATCDGPLYKGRDVAVIGCGNSGLQEGEALLGYVSRVTFIEFLPHMNAEKILRERLLANEKTDFLLNNMLTSINGENAVSSVMVKDRETGEEKEIKVSGVFIYAGFLPNTAFLEGIVELDDAGYVIANESMETSMPGIYAVGDVRSKKVRQVSTANADGTIAAVSVREYLKR